MSSVGHLKCNLIVDQTQSKDTPLGENTLAFMKIRYILNHVRNLQSHLAR